VVFTTLFAAGLVLMSQVASRVDLDPGCVLYGVLEASPLDTADVGGFAVPRVVLVLSLVLMVNLSFIVLMFKELLISSFDPGLATTEGCSARLMHYLLMVIVALTTVASFEATGNILVVAMLVVPPSTALLLTDRLGRMIAISAAVAAVSAVLGDVAAVTVPAWFGFRSTSTAAMMTVCAGLLFLLAALCAPSRGLIAVWLRRQRLSLRILTEDVIALMYRLDERGADGPVAISQLSQTLLSSTLQTWLALQWQRFRGRVNADLAGYRLTPAGRQAAAALVRSHRLWETYLVQEGVDAGVIHRQAEVLEHFTGRALREKLRAGGVTSDRDPHGSLIPDEDPGTEGR
jgi:manganese/zinc/iron transport system permease protein